MTITKEERVARARASCDGKVDADDVLALLDALAAAEARAWDVGNHISGSHEGFPSTGCPLCEAGLPSTEQLAHERAAREKAERERDEARADLVAVQSVGCARSDHKHFDVQFARTLKAEAGAAVMREALEALQGAQNGPPLVREEAEWRTAMDKSFDALATDAGKALLEEVKALRAKGQRDERQGVVTTWCAEAFGSEHATSLPRRGLRLLEEATEAAQACGVPLDKAQHVVAYVYGRPAGELRQELGGVGVTLLALAAAAHLSADDEEAREVARVLSKPLEHFRRRNDEKDAAGLTIERVALSTGGKG